MEYNSILEHIALLGQKYLLIFIPLITIWASDKIIIGDTTSDRIRLIIYTAIVFISASALSIILIYSLGNVIPASQAVQYAQ